MGLFTDPVVLSDGTANHSFSFLKQLTGEKKTISGGVYIEDAATLAAKSLLTIKHDTGGNTPRDLVQRTINKVPAASTTGEARPITVNFTLQADPLFTAAELATEVTIMKNAMLVTDFVSNLRAGKI